jgi:hypothetical protein
MKNFVFLVFAAGVIPIDAATIALSPASMAVSPGHVISLDLVISNLGSILVGDFDLDIGFDPSVLTLNSATPGSHLGDIASGRSGFQPRRNRTGRREYCGGEHAFVPRSGRDSDAALLTRHALLHSRTDRRRHDGGNRVAQCARGFDWNGHLH